VTDSITLAITEISFTKFYLFRKEVSEQASNEVNQTKVSHLHRPADRHGGEGDEL
jgi:hypothetical protein